MCIPNFGMHISKSATHISIKTKPLLLYHFVSINNGKATCRSI